MRIICEPSEIGLDMGHSNNDFAAAIAESIEHMEAIYARMRNEGLLDQTDEYSLDAERRGEAAYDADPDSPLAEPPGLYGDTDGDFEQAEYEYENGPIHDRDCDCLYCNEVDEGIEPLPQVVGHRWLAGGASTEIMGVLFVSVAEAVYREMQGDDVHIVLHENEYWDTYLLELKERARARWENDSLPDGWTKPIKKNNPDDELMKLKAKFIGR